ncbi:hypothetical protein [Alsobacter sp. R-9]
MFSGIWGESDVLSLFEKDGIRTVVLIEHKIAAAFTHTQGERFHDRGQELVAKGVAARYQTVPVAPRA